MPFALSHLHVAMFAGTALLGRLCRPHFRAMEGLTLGDTLQVNSLVWITSLGEHERNPSRRMMEDLAPLATAAEMRFEEVVVGHRDGLLRALADLADQAVRGLRPILHFDCHGSAEHGLELRPSGEFLDWGELVEALRTLNAATGNNLCCVFGVCFGLHMSKQLTLSLPTPYYLTIAPESEITVGVLEERTAPFYREVFESGDITAAYAKVLKPDLHLFLCKAVFAEALAAYIANNCVGAEARARRERMVTAVLEKERITDPTAAQLREARRKIKAALEPSQWLIDHYASTFLLGRAPGFGYAELERLADVQIKRARLRERRQAHFRG